MFMSESSDTTELLVASSAGDRDALDALLQRMYDDLRMIAHARLRRQRPGETMNTTGLVHEAYLRLVDGKHVGLRDRAHFFAIAARAMRFVLVDYAREQSAQKRGGGIADIRFDGRDVAGELDRPDDATRRALDLISVDVALGRLAAFDERLSELVELRFFGGLTYDEIAEITQRSIPTVKRDWTRARTWLFREMREAGTQRSR